MEKWNQYREAIETAQKAVDSVNATGQRSNTEEVSKSSAGPRPRLRSGKAVQTP
jgi:hypothetical protein